MRRREFFKLSAITSLYLATSSSALADGDEDNNDNSDYKAIVVLNLTGGNDGFNMFIPTSDDEKLAIHLMRRVERI